MDIEAHIRRNRFSLCMDLIQVDESPASEMLTFNVNISDYALNFFDQVTISTLQLDQFIDDIERKSGAVLYLSSIPRQNKSNIILKIDRTSSAVIIYYIKETILPTQSKVSHKHIMHTDSIEMSRFCSAFIEFPRWW